MRWPFLLLGLSGCQLVFELRDEPTTDAPPDSAPTDADPLAPDEDDDGFPDDSDNCPGVKNEDQATGDGDTVGTACDPYPGQIGDRIFARMMFAGGFDGLNAGGMTPLAVTNGSIVTSGAPDDVDATLRFVAVDDLRDRFERFGLSVEVGFEVLDLGTPANSNLFQIKLATDANNIQCGVSDDDPSTSTSTATLEGTDGPKDISPVTIRPSSKQQLVFGAHADRGAFCTFDGSRETGFGDAIGDVSVTLVIQHMDVRINYVVIYDNGVPK